MAILWWMATGTFQKMERDVGDKYTAQAFWIPQFVQDPESSLEISHVLLSIIVLVVGLILSKFVFFGELLFNLYRKRVLRKSVSFTKVKERKTANEIVSYPPQSVANVTENPTSLSVGDFEIKTVSID